MPDEPFLPVRLPVNQTTNRRMLAKIAIIIISITLLAALGWFLGCDWYWFAWEIVGAVLVASGCIAEWILLFDEEHEHSEQNKRLEKAWALVVAAGVTMDVFGLIHGIPEAIKLENRVEELRGTNDALEAKMHPRTITAKQVADFIFLTEKLPKIKIRTAVGPLQDETVNYCYQIRAMLDQAGFERPDSDTNLSWGIHPDPSALITFGPVTNADGTITHEWPDIILVADTNKSYMSRPFLMEITNGLTRPIIDANDPYLVAEGIANALIKIGFTVGIKEMPKWVSPNHYEILVVQRPY